MKKYSLCLSVCILSFLGLSKSFADPFSGFYVSALGGGSFFNGTEDALFNRTTIPEVGLGSFSAPGNHPIRSNSLIGMLTLGYGETFCNQGYLGGEFYVDWTNHKDTTHVATRINGLNVTAFDHRAGLRVDPFSYGFDLRPGYQICDPSLLYVRVGVGVKRVRQFANVRGTLFGNNTFVDISHSTSRAKTRAVLRLGLGFEYALFENLNFRADYIFTYLGNYSVQTEFSRTTNIFESLRISNHLHLVNNAFLFGLSWHCW